MANMANPRSVRQLKRKNRRKSIFIVILILIIAILIGCFGIFAIKEYKASKEPSFEYVSMTEEASARALVWLSQIDDIDLSYDDVENCMGSFNLEVVKTPTEEKGVYTISLADNSYEYCQSQAQTGFEKAYKSAVKSRIIASGYEGNVSDETIEDLMMQTFGMSVSEYLKQCNVKLLPAKDELLQEVTLKYASKEDKEVTDEENK